MEVVDIVMKVLGVTYIDARTKYEKRYKIYVMLLATLSMTLWIVTQIQKMKVIYINVNTTSVFMDMVLHVVSQLLTTVSMIVTLLEKSKSLTYIKHSLRNVNEILKTERQVKSYKWRRLLEIVTIHVVFFSVNSLQCLVFHTSCMNRTMSIFNKYIIVLTFIQCYQYTDVVKQKFITFNERLVEAIKLGLFVHGSYKNRGLLNITKINQFMKVNQELHNSLSVINACCGVKILLCISFILVMIVQVARTMGNLSEVIIFGDPVLHWVDVCLLTVCTFCCDKHI